VHNVETEAFASWLHLSASCCDSSGVLDVVLQTTTTMILQGERMDARIGDDPTKLLPVASLNFVKMAVITLLIPVLDRVVFPLMDSVDRKPTLLQRIGQ